MTPSPTYRQSFNTTQRQRRFLNPQQAPAAPGTTGQPVPAQQQPRAMAPAPAPMPANTPSAGVPRVPQAQPTMAQSTTAPAPDPQTYTGAPLPANVKPLNAKKAQRQLLNLQLQNAQAMNPYLISAVRTLQGDASQNRMSDANRAAFLAPRLESLNTAEGQAMGNATADAEGRGLGDSSYAAAKEAAIQSGFAGQRSGAINQLYNAEDERQQAAKSQLMAVLASLVGGNASGAASIAGNLRSQNLQDKQFKQSQQFDLGGLLGSLIGAGGQIGASFIR